MLSDFAPSLQAARFYPQLRTGYLRVFKHAYWKKYIHGLREFYRPFIAPGSLVFDIGANVGEYSQAFLALGARVVAVEPNPELAAKLSRLRNQRWTSLECAVGETAGTLPMRLSDMHTLGTLSEDWLKIATQTKRLASRHWERTVIVPVRTLDSLIAQYGRPDFIKIDVEGFELQALRGLKSLPKSLSFEFNGEWTKPTLECLRQPCFPAETRFNYIIGDSQRFALLRWIGAREMAEIAQETLPRHDYGDIFARIH
jgi:FkbM family methyltransferase